MNEQIRAYADLPTGWFEVREPTPTEKRAAMLIVAANSASAESCRHTLEMLGLMPNMHIPDEEEVA